jgi:type IV pilus assembly protein PilV
MTHRWPIYCRGSSMLEVLVTIGILMVGLLGLAKLQGVATTSQMEAYQRSQALILLKDMAERINANRANASSYVTNTPLGTGSSQTTSCGGLSGKDLDSCQWQNALLGAAEMKGTDNVGGVIAARGCIYEVAPATPTQPGRYVIAVAWQGFNKTVAPSAIDCGEGAYGDDALRRVITMPLTIAKLN